MDLTKIWTKENVNFTRRTLKKLDQDDPHLADIYGFIDDKVPNIWLVLAYLSKTLKLFRYAELGTRRGFSMAIVGARRPGATLVSFDIWISGYAGSPNPGPDFVKSELQKVGHKGDLEFIEGDCSATVPAYGHGGILFPIILADAGHDYDSVYRDINNCLPLLAPGGYLVIDDLQDANVRAAWDAAIAQVECWTWQQGRVGVIRNG